MENELEFIRNRIKEKGFMSATKIALELDQRNNSKKDIKIILNSIIGNGFHKIKYTNRYVEKYTDRMLFYYNPNKKGRGPKNMEHDVKR